MTSARGRTAVGEPEVRGPTAAGHLLNQFPRQKLEYSEKKKARQVPGFFRWFKNLFLCAAKVAGSDKAAQAARRDLTQ